MTTANNRTHYWLSVFAFTVLSALTAVGGEAPPDLTKAGIADVDRKKTYNLGSTGLRGWIYHKPVSYHDGLQGRTTQLSRQILVTHVGAKSPADGVLAVDDLILGIGDKPFTDDARKSFAHAIQEAEKESNGGVLKVLRWRKGKTESVPLQLRVMGTYSATAPYNCPKSKKIYEEACVALEKEELKDAWNSAVSGLALLATGKKEYLPRVKELAYVIGPKDLELKVFANAGVVWHWGYKLIFLCEYYLATNDKDILPAITKYATGLARGQSLYGTFGHKLAEKISVDGVHGSIGPYGPINMAGLPANLGILLSKKCGIKDPEIDAAIERAMGFFGYYVDKGTIPYGEHEPYHYHENNGKSSLCSVMFSLQPGQKKAAQYFAKMATAGFMNRECGHTGQGFSYLWSALGANAGGPDPAAAFFREASWHLDLVRRSDGSFTYDGGEQYGPGKTDDDTYYGNSSYFGLSPNATYVLTYAMPLKNIYITGRDANKDYWLSKHEVADAIDSGHFDLERSAKNPQELMDAFADWSPIARSWAANELAQRPEAKTLVPKLITLADNTDPHVVQGACEALGLLKSTEALPVLARQLTHKDRGVGLKVAKALRNYAGAAAPILPDMVKALVTTADPISPINWEDPIQFAHGQLAYAVFKKPLADGLKDIDQKLLMSAITAVSNNPSGNSRNALSGYFKGQLTLEEVQKMGPLLLEAIKSRSPADSMFRDSVRLSALKALTKYHFKEGIEATIMYAKTHAGHGSEKKIQEVMKNLRTYGSSARHIIPGLHEVIGALNDMVERKEYPGGKMNAVRVKEVEDTIKAIEAAKEAPALRSFSSPSVN